MGAAPGVGGSVHVLLGAFSVLLPVDGWVYISHNILVKTPLSNICFRKVIVALNYLFCHGFVN